MSEEIILNVDENLNSGAKLTIPSTVFDEAFDIELRKTATDIEWKLQNDTTWLPLVALNDIKGEQGIQGSNGLNAILFNLSAPPTTQGKIGDAAFYVEDTILKFAVKLASGWDLANAKIVATGFNSSNYLEVSGNTEVPLLGNPIRYVRHSVGDVYRHGEVGWKNASFFELKVLNDANINVAAGLLPTTNGVAAGQSIAVLTNESPFDWGPIEIVKESFPKWVQLDLGTVRTDVQKIQWVPTWETGWIQYDVQVLVSEDGVNWYTAYQNDEKGQDQPVQNYIGSTTMVTDLAVNIAIDASSQNKHHVTVKGNHVLSVVNSIPGQIGEILITNDKKYDIELVGEKLYPLGTPLKAILNWRNINNKIWWNFEHVAVDYVNYALLTEGTGISLASGSAVAHEIKNIINGRIIPYGPFHEIYSCTLNSEIVINFNQTRAINTIKFYKCPDTPTVDFDETQLTSNYGVTHFTIDYWDGNKWVNIAKEENNLKLVYKKSFPTVSTDQIRLIATQEQSAAGECRVLEIEAYHI